jgi:hypothetical protein
VHKVHKVLSRTQVSKLTRVATTKKTSRTLTSKRFINIQHTLKIAIKRAVLRNCTLELNV